MYFLVNLQQNKERIAYEDNYRVRVASRFNLIWLWISAVTNLARLMNAEFGHVISRDSFTSVSLTFPYGKATGGFPTETSLMLNIRSDVEQLVSLSFGTNFNLTKERVAID